MTSFQIETTTRCTLKCPACSRTVFAEKTNRPMPHYDVDVDQLHYFLDCSKGKQIDTLDLCGDYGDSIYYPNLFYLLEKFKPDKKIHIATNGAYRDKKYWTELVSRLDSNDQITFGIDGLEDTNHLYRVNSDWDSTMLGLDIVVNAGIPVIWKTNIFSFNYNKLEQIKEFAESRGAKFLANKTGRFGRDDLVPPSDFVSSQEIYFPEYSRHNHKVDIDPDCKNLHRNTICARNYFWPCGYIRFPLTFYKMNLWKEREQWAIAGKRLDDLHATSLEPWVQNILNDPENVNVVCKMKCKVNQSPIEWVKVQ